MSYGLDDYENLDQREPAAPARRALAMHLQSKGHTSAFGAVRRLEFNCLGQSEIVSWHPRATRLAVGPDEKALYQQQEKQAQLLFVRRNDCPASFMSWMTTRYFEQPSGN